jgi:hypothetical protein
MENNTFPFAYPRFPPLQIEPLSKNNSHIQAKHPPSTTICYIINISKDLKTLINKLMEETI